MCKSFTGGNNDEANGEIADKVVELVLLEVLKLSVGVIGAIEGLY